MAVPVTAETRHKLEHIPERLSDEFEDVEPGEVKDEVVETAEQLLRAAHFTDFVPLLAHRITREHLLDEGHQPRRTE